MFTLRAFQDVVAFRRREFQTSLRQLISLEWTTPSPSVFGCRRVPRFETLENRAMLATAGDLALQVTRAAWTEGETIDFAIHWNQPAAESFNLDFVIEAPGSGPNQFTPTSSNISVAAGETSAPNPIKILPDLLPEDDFELTLKIIRFNGVPLDSPKSLSVTVYDDDDFGAGPAGPDISSWEMSSFSGPSGPSGPTGPTGPSCPGPESVSVTVAPGTLDEGEVATATASIPGAGTGATVEIDWGDGTIGTMGLVYDGGGTCDTIWEASHIYVDDDPSVTPSDQYTITVEASHNNLTAEGTTTIVVDNVNPGVVIDFIEADDTLIDNDRVDETEGFSIHGRVVDPGLADTHVATLTIDLNFDGDFGDPGEVQLVGLSGPNFQGEWSFQHHVGSLPDDGATYDGNGNRIWGNETVSDTISFTIDVEDDDTGLGSASDSAAIYNVAPEIWEYPTLSYDLDTEGYVTSATVSGAFTDPGTLDFHEVTVNWGDGQTSGGDPLPLGERNFSFTRTFAPGSQVVLEDLIPIVVNVTDDDMGSDSKPAESTSVNITIHNGQLGDAVSEENEVIVGAVTVANMNNTDGDGTIDFEDNSVLESDGFLSPSGVRRGRDEHDLMRLDLHKPVGYDKDAGIPVSLTVSNTTRIKLWKKPTKEEAIALDGNKVDIMDWEANDWDTNATTGTKTIWVEITSYSEMVSDLKLILNYGAESDTVSATGIWAKRSDIEYGATDFNRDFTMWPEPWINAPDDIKNIVTFVGGPVPNTIGTGLRDWVDGDGNERFYNVILFEFQVYPPNAQEYFSDVVRFDVTRQKIVKHWDVTAGGVVTLVENHAEPDKWEQANDDGFEAGELRDESMEPDENGKMYSVDAPLLGHTPGTPPGLTSYYRGNFHEYVRVLLNGVKPDGDTLQGSLSSSRYRWHSRTTIQRAVVVADSTRVNDAATGKYNDVAPGHITIGDQP